MSCDYRENADPNLCPEQQPPLAQRPLREEIEERYGIRPGVADILFYKNHGYIPSRDEDHVGEPD